MKYTTLGGKIFDLDSLPKPHREVYEEVKNYSSKQREWVDFSVFWLNKVRAVGASANSDLWMICQDLDSRIGIRQGYTRLPNWREELDSLIKRRFKSKYEFCQVVGLDQGHLSRILNSKKGLSVPNLIRILDKIGSRMIFVEKEIPLTGEE